MYSREECKIFERVLAYMIQELEYYDEVYVRTGYTPLECDEVLNRLKEFNASSTDLSYIASGNDIPVLRSAFVEVIFALGVSDPESLFGANVAQMRLLFERLSLDMGVEASDNYFDNIR